MEAPKPAGSDDQIGMRTLSRPELGTKHVCPECGKKYYDLNRDPAICPGCGFAIETESETPDEMVFSAGGSAVRKEADVKPPENSDEFDDDEAGVIDSATDLADLSDSDGAKTTEDGGDDQSSKGAKPDAKDKDKDKDKDKQDS